MQEDTTLQELRAALAEARRKRAEKVTKKGPKLLTLLVQWLRCSPENLSSRLKVKLSAEQRVCRRTMDNWLRKDRENGGNFIHIPCPLWQATLWRGGKRKRAGASLIPHSERPLRGRGEESASRLGRRYAGLVQ